MIGVASPTFCFSPFQEAMERISRHFDLWEVLVEGRHGLASIREGVASARTSFDMRFQVHAPMSDVNIGSVYEPMRLAAVEEIGKVIGFCRDLDIGLVTIHPGFVQGIAFLGKERVAEQTHVSLKELAGVAEENGVALALENMPTGINATCTTAAELARVLEGTGIGMCFDLGHANTAGQVDAMLEHVDRFLNVHLHNNDGTWDQHRTIDDGTAPLERAVESIKRSYGGNWIIEAENLESAVMSKRVLEGLLEHPPATQAL